ncbi:MAG TPA: TatD family hydrolase [Opitutaceae bacterium]|nr:TatD family hydrolase [Opitutaceae bacterium]
MSHDAAAPAAKRVRYFDAHNHLQDEWLKPHRDRIVAQLTSLPVHGVVVNGTEPRDWDDVAALAREFSWVIPSYGLHPWHAGNAADVAAGGNKGWLITLREKLVCDPRAGVGEIGLDRWMLERARADDARLAGLRRAGLDEQLDVFRAQLHLATELERPVTIHCIDAWGALLEVLQSRPLPRRGFLLHAYAGSAEMLKRFLRLGAYISFNGYFLNERKARERDVFRDAPLDRLLVETDAPAMSLPAPWRTHKLPPTPSGETINHPANIEAAYAGLAALRGMSVADLCDVTERNFKALFSPTNHTKDTKPNR